jgi:hypothetical protein
LSDCEGLYRRRVMERELRAQALGELEELASVISGPLMLWSNEVFVGREVASQAIELFRSRGYVILGFEGFNTDGVYRVPQEEFIADFSSIDGTWSERVERSADAAVLVMSKWHAGPQFVTFVVDREEHGADVGQRPGDIAGR